MDLTELDVFTMYPLIWLSSSRLYLPDGLILPGPWFLPASTRRSGLIDLRALMFMGIIVVADGCGWWLWLICGNTAASEKYSGKWMYSQCNTKKRPCLYPISLFTLCMGGAQQALCPLNLPNSFVYRTLTWCRAWLTTLEKMWDFWTQTAWSSNFKLITLNT